MPPPSLDPVRFCETQINTLRGAIERLQATVERLTEVIEDLHEGRSADVERGVDQAFDRLAHDSERGRPYWTSGADHIGRRWYDTWTQWLGSWLTKAVGGAILVIVLAWYFSRGGKA